jgi:hypothetical protein
VTRHRPYFESFPAMRKRTTPPSRKASSPSTTVTAHKPARRGRPPIKAFINVEVKATTRDGLNALKQRLGLRSQGEVLAVLVEAALAGGRGRARGG